MAKDVFISYSSVDSTAADTVCSILEQNGISCWIAPRDITPGLDFAEAIIDGIKSSKLFILVYSSNSNNSKQVIREVDRAVHLGLPVINLKLEDVPLSKQLEYYLSSVHWLDAKTPPLEEHINKLSGVVKILLRKDGAREEDLEKAIRDGILQVGQDKKSIAVLPFKNMSKDPDQEYFSDGMMEEILDRLFKIGDLKVISRTSSMRYKNSDKPIKEIARELGVASIIEGSVRRAGNSVRIAVQLIDAGSDAHLWSEIYNGDLSDLSRIFVIQSEVAQSVATELKAVLSPQEVELIEKIPTKNIGAYETYLKGRFYAYKLTQNDLETATKYFENAIELDPEYALAHAGIALVWAARVQFGFTSPEVAGPKIQESLMKALELDSSNAEVQYTLAAINTWVMWDWEGGEEAFKKAIAINPNHSEAHAYYSHFLLNTGRPENEATEQINIALKLDPLNPMIWGLYGVVLIITRRYYESINACKEALRIDPDNHFATSTLAEALYLSGHKEEALQKLKSYLKIMNIQDAIDAIDRGIREKDYKMAFQYMAESLEKMYSNNFGTPWEIAQRFAAAGNKEKALHWLEVAYETRDQGLPYLCWPFFDLLRDEPRFQEIARKMNLPYK
ncbi:MAG: TIR domain-containing protein [Bacteroidales bacterium]|nr:TIR domain-containing protein [Bacteroidales bacterium]